MNRNNFWIHLGIAVIVITFAAVLGQISRWEKSLRVSVPAPSEKVKTASKPTAVKRSNEEGIPEVNVRFRPNVSLAEIKKIAAKNNDRVEDEIESVKGLVSIDDLDNADAETVAAQYKAMSDLVEYAEPNFQIKFDDPVPTTAPKDLLQRESNEEIQPNDPKFAEQWALSNLGQNGGKKNADIGALKAWLKTQGSDKVVVAVLDSGVDYTHPDLVGNIWFRPESIPQYKDDELGVVNDYKGFNAADNQSDPMDDNGHGTHCAGIIGAEGNNDEGITGINWNVQIMPLKFMGRGGFGTTKDAIEAINYAIDRKRNGVNVRVINASWGSTLYSKALEDAIRAAGEEG
ncbi:MAG TPA: S8 family serine peptidase, partial [Pyrinomonadaceae bacterium]|nr:S8 family serine peptidase [Pyrinomonadaceae bacterium]